MATNIPTYAANLTVRTARQAEVPDASFSNGMNNGSCSGGLGINTGDYDPKATDFSRIEDTTPHQTQLIGGSGVAAGDNTSFAIRTVQGADVNDEVAFVQADASTAPDAVLDVTTGAVNKQVLQFPLTHGFGVLYQ